MKDFMKMFIINIFKSRRAYLLFSLILIGIVIAGCGGTGKWNPPPVTDTAAPAVTAVVPLNNASGVAINTKVITAAFSEAMDPATITTATFTLMQGVTEIPGSVAYVDVTATFTPDSALDELTTYTATIKTGPAGAKDVAGNELVGN